MSRALLFFASMNLLFFMSSPHVELLPAMQEGRIAGAGAESEMLGAGLDIPLVKTYNTCKRPELRISPNERRKCHVVRS
jgi:hypothetical protein